MTLASMPIFGQGVILAVAPDRYQKALPPGTHVKITAKDSQQTRIEANGKPMTILTSLAAEIVVIKQIT